MPALTDIGETYRWTRDELFASGALTLTDLLERIPGVTTFRSGWLGAPHTAAMMGDFSRVRIFYDGIELDPLDPRMGGMNDIAAIQLWQLEELRIERGAGEIRVYTKSWRVRSTTPNSRVDIATGDLETNGYRGYFGRRFTHGEVLQLGAYQFRTQDPRGQGDADQLSLFGRVGWAKKGFSIDGSFMRTNRTHSLQFRDPDLERDSLPSLDARYGQAYARIGYADTTRGYWVQLIAASLSHSQNNLAFKATTTDTTDTAKVVPSRLDFSRPQYIAAFGWEKDGATISSTTRMRSIGGQLYVAPSVRASYDAPRIAVSLFGEQQPELNLRRIEASGRLLPLSWFALGGAVGQYAHTGAPSTASPTTLAWRGEVGLRVHRAWFSGGLMSRDTAVLIAPVVYDTGFKAAVARNMTGTFLRFRGKFWKDVGIDVSAVKWDSAGSFRPEYQTRSQLYANTAWLRKFPSGNFNILFALTHEYRTVAYFPIGGAEPLRASQYRTLDMLLEIRLLQATLTYQFRNLLNADYTQVPGYGMHRPVQVYGVRWQFFN